MLTAEEKAKNPTAVWIDCPYPALTFGLARIIEAEVLRVYSKSEEPPEGDEISLIVLYADGINEVSEGFSRIERLKSDASVLVFSTRTDSALIKAALQMGARGFLHARMSPSHIIRALSAAFNGELVIPRMLVEPLVMERQHIVDPGALTARQREILEMVAADLSNAQIATRLFLSEATVKQHLRTAYRVLGVDNRKEAGQLIRGSGAPANASLPWHHTRP